MDIIASIFGIELEDGYCLVFRACTDRDIQEISEYGKLRVPEKNRGSSFDVAILDTHIRRGHHYQFKAYHSFTVKPRWIFFYYCKQLAFGDKRKIMLAIIKEKDLFNPLDVLQNGTQAFFYARTAKERIPLKDLRIYEYWLFEPYFLNMFQIRFAKLFRSIYGYENYRYSFRDWMKENSARECYFQFIRPNKWKHVVIARCN